ncbi:hypothetical protein HSX11_15510 [Oxalobacteraceae bacterium]|nr:hypothetical protein [Oxalobacteraceae bacterium]
MPRVFGQALRIGVSATSISLLRTSRWRAPSWTLLGEQAVVPLPEGAPYEAIAQALRSLLAAHAAPGWPLCIVLADELTRLWQVSPPAGATRLADIQAAAGLRFNSLYGDAPAAWEIAADWQAGSDFFAAAMPRALLALLRAVAQEQRLALVEIVPQWIGSWNRWQGALKPNAWFGQLHEQVLTLGARSGKRLCAVRTLALPHGADQYWLGQVVAREALLLGLEPPALLQLCGAAPAGWFKPASNPAHLACVALDAGQATLAATLSPAAALARCGSTV